MFKLYVVGVSRSNLHEVSMKEEFSRKRDKWLHDLGVVGGSRKQACRGLRSSVFRYALCACALHVPLYTFPVAHHVQVEPIFTSEKFDDVVLSYVKVDHTLSEQKNSSETGNEVELRCHMSQNVRRRAHRQAHQEGHGVPHWHGHMFKSGLDCE